MHPGYSLLDALFMNPSASPFFWLNQFPTFKAEKGMTRHPPFLHPCLAYQTVYKSGFCFPAATDTNPKSFMLFVQFPLVYRF